MQLIVAGHIKYAVVGIFTHNAPQVWPLAGLLQSLRIRTRDATVARTVLREERLLLALPPSSPLAANRGPILLKEIAQERLIVFPKEPRPSYADHVLSLLNDQNIRLAEVHEVRELQAALGLVACEMGVCIIPAAARLRSDLVYRLIDDERATSPVIFSHRLNDDSWYISAIKELIGEMYSLNPAWLDFETNDIPKSRSQKTAVLPKSTARSKTETRTRAKKSNEK